MRRALDPFARITVILVLGSAVVTGCTAAEEDRPDLAIRSSAFAEDACDAPPDDDGENPIDGDDSLECASPPPSSPNWPSASPPPPSASPGDLPAACSKAGISCQPKIPRVRGGGSPEDDPKNCQDISFEGCARLIAKGCNCALVHIDCDDPGKVGHFIDSSEVACGGSSPPGTRCFVLNDPETGNIRQVDVPPGGDVNGAITSALSRSNMNPCGRGRPYHVEFGPGDRHPCSWPGNTRPAYDDDVDCSPINPDGGGGGACCVQAGGASCMPDCDGGDCGDGGCGDTTSDPNNCGSCGNVCPGGATCSGGVCQGYCGDGICDEGCDACREDCGSCYCRNDGDCAGLGGTCCTDFLATPYCTDIMTDTANCGGCGNACADGCCDGHCCPAPDGGY